LLQVVCRTVRVGVPDRPCVGRTVRLGTADCPRGTSCPRTVRGPGTDCPFFHGASLVVLLHFTDCPPRVADRPPQARGPSAWHYAGLLSPLLLVLCFRFKIVWGLFLGLVGDLGKLVWESLVVSLGQRPSSLFEEEFLSSLIHSRPL
jgi:hypothetical protein